VIVKIDHPSEVTLGDSFAIYVQARNDGEEAQWQTIAISFPASPRNVSIEDSTLDPGSTKVYWPGETMWGGYGTKQLALSYPVAEGSAGSWPRGAAKYLKVTVKPEALGNFVFLVKTVAGRKSDGVCIAWDPKSGPTDQQGECGYQRVVRVVPQPSNPVTTNVRISRPDSNVPEPTPITIARGGRFRAWYEVSNPNQKDVTVGLGLSIRAPDGTIMSDPQNDRTFIVRAGQSEILNRFFIVPPDAPPGTYSVIFGLWSGHPGTSTQLSQDEYRGWLDIASQFTLALDSITQDGRRHLGQIEFKNTRYDLPVSITTETISSVGVAMYAPSGYVYDHWEASGGISIHDFGNGTASISVNGDGSLTALYKFGGTFDVSASPTAVSLNPGETTTVSIALVSRNAFSGPVDLGLMLASGAPFPNWLEASYDPDTQDLPANGSAAASLSLSVSSTAPPGNHQFLVNGNSGNAFRTVPFSVTVKGQGQTPVLSISPEAIDFGARATSADFLIGNRGAGTLTWSVSTDQRWLTLGPTGGSGDGAVIVDVERNGLNDGNYFANITVNSNGGSKIIPVRMKVSQSPEPYDFSLSVRPSTVILTKGQMSGYIDILVRLTSDSPPNLWVDLDLLGLPSNIGEYKFNPRYGRPANSLTSALTISIFENAPEGEYLLTVTASGDGVSKKSDLKLQILSEGTTQDNNPPQINAVIFDPPLEKGIIAGMTFHISVEATDPDGDILSYKISLPHPMKNAQFDKPEFDWEVPNAPDSYVDMYVVVTDGKDKVEWWKDLEISDRQKGAGWESYLLGYSSLPKSIGGNWPKGSATIFGASRLDIAPWAKYLTPGAYVLKDTISLASTAMSLYGLAKASNLPTEQARLLIPTRLGKMFTTEMVELASNELNAKVVGATFATLDFLVTKSNPYAIPVKVGDAILEFVYKDVDQLMEQGWDVLKEPKGGVDEPYSVILVEIHDVTERQKEGIKITSTYEDGYKFYYYDPTAGEWLLWEDVTIDVVTTSYQSVARSEPGTTEVFEVVDDYFQNKPSQSTGGRVPTEDDVFNQLDRYFKGTSQGHTSSIATLTAPTPMATSATDSEVFDLLDAYFQDKPSQLTGGRVPTVDDVFDYIDHYFGR
jgi:hypothetical protein